VTSACSFSSSFNGCVALASSLCVACSLVLLLRFCRCRFLFVCRLLSFASTRSCTSSPSSSSSKMYLPSDFYFRLLFIFVFRRLHHCRFLFGCRYSLSLLLALTRHRQAHRRLQCICPVTFTSACSVPSPSGDCVAVAYSLAVAALSLPLVLAHHRRITAIKSQLPTRLRSASAQLDVCVPLRGWFRSNHS
jgi:hypothetical protein